MKNLEKFIISHNFFFHFGNCMKEAKNGIILGYDRKWLIFPYYIRLLEVYFEYIPSKKSVPCKLFFQTLIDYVCSQVNFPVHICTGKLTWIIACIHDITDCAHHVTRITTSWVCRGSLSRSLQRTLRCFLFEGISSLP